MSKSAKIVISICALIFSIFVCGWFYGVKETKQLREDLSARGVTTSGKIYEITNGVRGRKKFLYSFQVNEYEYRGNFNANRNSFQIGDIIRLKYDPLDPSRNEWIRTPMQTSKKTTGNIIFCIIIGICVGIYYFFRIRKEFR